MKVFGRTCRRRLSYHQTVLCKYLHLQINLFIIYNESKGAPQRPSHDKVPLKTRRKLIEKQLTQKHDSNKAATMHIY